MLSIDQDDIKSKYVMSSVRRELKYERASTS